MEKWENITLVQQFNNILLNIKSDFQDEQVWAILDKSELIWTSLGLIKDKRAEKHNIAWTALSTWGWSKSYARSKTTLTCSYIM